MGSYGIQSRSSFHCTFCTSCTFRWRYTMRHTILLSLLLALIGCSSKGVVGPVPLNQEFSLRINQTALVKGALTIRLDSVPEDSRCPLGVMCIQAGNAVVALTVTPEGGSPSQVRLNTNP